MDLKGKGAAEGAGPALDSRYQARGLLGLGAMGEVHLCRDGWLGRDVAVKTVTRDASAPDMRARFLREARIQGQLEHPSIVPVYDMGKDVDGNEFFTMKRVSGRTLSDVLEDLAVGDSDALSSEFSRTKLLGIFRQVCLAIEYAHSRGVMHRDLKPANLMVGQFGEVYVLDWGLARVRAVAGGSFVPVDGVPASASAGRILGTPGYMAPEQIESADAADERADVYALGSILFEILTLTPLNPGLTHEARLRSTRLGKRVRPSEVPPTSTFPPSSTLFASAQPPTTSTSAPRARGISRRPSSASSKETATSKHAAIALAGTPTRRRRRPWWLAERVLARTKPGRRPCAKPRAPSCSTRKGGRACGRRSS